MKLEMVSARGIQSSEKRAIERLAAELPDSWMGYASFLISDGSGTGMEIDLLLVTADRFIVCEIKEWGGEIRSDGKNWIQKIGRVERSHASPVEIKRQHAQRINTLLNKNMQSLWGTWYKVDFMVIMAGSAKFTQKSPLDNDFVLSLDDFCQIGNPTKYQSLLPKLPSYIVNKMNSNQILRPNNPTQIKIFNTWRTGGGAIKKRYRTEFNYIPSSDLPSFTQPNKSAYKEFEGANKQAPGNKALMRFWDFNQLGVFASTTTQRAIIGLREQNVNMFVGENNYQLKKDYLMDPLHNYDPEECKEDMVEVYGHSPSITSLSIYLYRLPHTVSSRLALLQEVIAPIAGLHALGVAHRDLSLERLWYDSICKAVIVSGLCTAKFPEVRGMESISDFYSLIATNIIRSPEDILGEPVLIASAIDVFQLGVIAYEIAYSQKPNMIDGLYEWINPIKDPFNGALDSWLKKALSLVPSDRFSNANEMLSGLNLIQLESQKKIVDDNQIIMTELQNYFKNTFPMTEWPMKIGDLPLHDQIKAKVTYKSSHHELDVRVSWWASLNPLPNHNGQNRRLLQFLKRCDAFKQNELPAPKVLDFATTNSGLYVVASYEEGVSLEKWIEDNKNNEYYLDATLNISLSIIHAVNQLHEINIGHGDLKLDNILVVSKDKENKDNNKLKILLIDCLDINHAAEPTVNYVYSPTVEATVIERDRYAVYQIVKDIVPLDHLQCKPLDKEIRKNIGESLDQIPLSLEPLSRCINTMLTPEIKKESLNFWHSDLGRNSKEISFKSDEGRYYVSAKLDLKNPENFAIYITGLTKKLTLIVALDNRSYIVKKSYIRDIPASELIQSSQFANHKKYASRPPILKHEINLLPASSESSLLKVILDLPSIRQDLNLDSEPKVSKDIKFTTLHLLWTALLEAEDSLYPVVSTHGMPSLYSKDDSRYWIFNITPPRKELEFESDSEIGVVERNNRGWVLGNLDHKRTLLNSGKLVVKSKSSNSKVFTQFEEGSQLSLQDRQASSSQDRRKRALERVLNGESLIPNLVHYFDTSIQNIVEDTKPFDQPSPEVMKLYKLDESKVNALYQILSKRVSVVMGPPGTGKTQLLAHLLDHFNRQKEIKRILLVSQSNVAVDEVATKARNTISDIAKLEGKDPASILPSMVRLGDREKVNEALHDIHVDALQSQYRTRFFREFELRMLAFSQSLGVSHEFMLDVTKLYREVGRELYEYKKDIKDLLQAGSEEDSAPNWKKEQWRTARIRKSRLEPILTNKLLAYVDDSNEVLDSDDPMLFLITRIGIQAGIHNSQQVAQLSELLSISHQWLTRLATDGAGFASFMSKTRQWIIGTLVGIGRPTYNIKDNQYDVAIIDEAGRASANELAMAMQSARRVILVGDYLQLPPVYDREVIKSVSKQLNLENEEVRKTDFERAFKASKGYMLSIQYRMAKPIGDLVSHVFYEEELGTRLETGRNTAAEWLEKLSAPWNKVVNWIDTSDIEVFESNQDKSIANQSEVEIIRSLLHNLIKDKTHGDNALEKLRTWFLEGKNPPIGIISGYSMQVREIERMIDNDSFLYQLRDLVRIDTIDSYQGSENRIILLSLVRHNESGATGFMEERPRINVAISRAQERLVIIGAAKMWLEAEEKSPLKSVYQYINQKYKNGDPNYQIINVNNLKSDGEII